MELPSGTVTFLFTDIEGSTGLWEEQPEIMQVALSRHDLLLRRTVEDHGGVGVKTTGDGLHAVFTTAPAALRATLAAQRALTSEVWDRAIGQLRVRMALYTGTAELRDGDYYGPALNRVARLLAAGHGGQILLSQSTQELVRDDLPEQVALVDLGEYRLRDVSRPEHLYQPTTLDLPAEFPPLKAFGAQRTNLPGQPTRFIGREHEREAVNNLIRRADVRLVTLTGPGGMGKTRLAIEVGGDLLSDFEDGVFFVDLAPITDPDQVIHSIAGALNVRESGGPALIETLKQRLGNKRMLLVLDNYEQVLDAAGMLDDLLQAGPLLKALVTSREALNLRQEWLYPLEGMAYPQANIDDGAASWDAIRLFVETAGRVRPDFSLAADVESVIRICQLVEGMPLAIELAAAWSKMLPPSAIVQEIEQGAAQQSLDGILSTRLRNLPERHRSVRAVYDYSWNLLAPEEQAVFRSLSVFRGGFLRPAAEKVAGATLPILTALVDKSLLFWEPALEQSPGYDLNRGRYHIHELLRQYAWERLELSPEGPESILDLHSDYFVEFLHEQASDITGAGQHKALAKITADLENVRVAWWRTVDQGNIDNIKKASYVLFMYSDFQGRFEEMTEALEKAIKKLENGQSDSEKNLVLAALFVYLGYDYIRLGRFEKARVAFEHSQNIYQSLDVSPPPLFSTDPLCGLALLAMTLGDYEEAIALGDEARKQCEQLDDKQDLQVALYVLIDAAAALGRFEIAQNYAQQAYAVTRETNNRWMRANILSLMGDASRGLGDYDQARQHYQASYGMKQEFNDPEGMAAALNKQARIAWMQEDYQGAERLYDRSVAQYRAIYDPGGLATALHGLGDTALATGDYQNARLNFKEALEIAADMNWTPLTLAIFVSVSDLLWQVDQRQRAVELLTVVEDHPASDQETKDLAERGLARAKTALSPESFQAAKEKADIVDQPKVIGLQDRDLVMTSAAVLQELEAPFDGEAVVVPTAGMTEGQIDQPLLDPLTPRELEVLKLIASGLTNREIAEQLVISVGTVKSYTGQIYSKLQVNSRTQAVARAREIGLLF